MKLSRRGFLIGAGLLGGGLALGFSLGEKTAVPHTRAGAFQPNAWLQITPDGEVIFQLDKAEMGQGVINSLSVLIGEELDFNPARMTIEFAGAYSGFRNPAMGVQITGGSTSVMTSWERLREAGATARAMLMAAAAKQWNVDAGACRTEDGVVWHPDGQQHASYGQLAVIASQLSAPGKVLLKDSADWKWIGKSQSRLDSPAKVAGKAQFGLDVQLPGMKVAVVVRCPYFGGQVRTFGKDAVSKLPGVITVFTIHSGIVIVADGYWPARQAANALQVEWDKGSIAGLDSAAILAAQKQALDSAKSPFSVLDEGDAETAFAAAANVVNAEYTAPYLHHSPMEPQNCTALFKDNRLELWAPTQTADIARAVAAFFSGLAQQQITVNSTFLGGGFGRRGYVDFAGEAAAIAVKMPGVPVKLMWSREDDMQHDYYRPATYHRLRAALDAGGNVTGWEHHLVGTSILKGFGADLIQGLLPQWVSVAVARGIGQDFADFVSPYDITMGEGAKIPYSIPNRKVGMVHHDPGVPTGFWRSVAHSYNAFIVESFIDELAHVAKQDPAVFRRHYLQAQPRHLGVLDLLLEKSKWQGPVSSGGFGRGLAVHESFGSVVGIVADVQAEGNRFRVTKLVCVVDCGIVVDPDQVVAQIEGGAIYGLTATIKNGVLIQDGACAQSNFHDLPVVRMDEVPDISVFLVPSLNPPSGIGEVAVPPVMPAVANALFAATGRRLRDLPLVL